ncbi:leucine carboxyl methyltransferase [Infundibulicybe gibba]|nr:leucine carboxyl methyltransferase [Infundibulicybe gibba]
MFSPSPSDPDACIRLTDTDAALARLSAVQKCYLKDPYISHLVPRARFQPPRPPLINIGTFVRSTAIDTLVHQWANLVQGKYQVVSLGAGSDTRFWRMYARFPSHRVSKYIEIDFPEVTSKKAMTIRKSKELSAILGEDVQLSQGGTALRSQKYHLLPADLRLPPSSTLGALFDPATPVLSHALPTLLIFECVLVYMPPEASASLLQWFADHTSILGAVIYEMFGLHDSFGQVMLSNLKSRNIDLPGAAPYPTVESLPSRLTQHGFTTSRAVTLKRSANQVSPQLSLRGGPLLFRLSYSHYRRISSLEMLDEVEELNLVLDHYAITWGVRIPDAGLETRRQWEAWA